MKIIIILLQMIGEGLLALLSTFAFVFFGEPLAESAKKDEALAATGSDEIKENTEVTYP